MIGLRKKTKNATMDNLTLRTIVIHPDDTLFITRQDRQLTLGEKEVSRRDTYAIDVFAEGNEFVRILLWCMGWVISTKRRFHATSETSDLERYEGDTFDCVAYQQQVLQCPE